MDAEAILKEMRLAVASPKIAGEFPGWKAGSGPESLVMPLPLDVQAETVATCRIVWRTKRFNFERDASATLVIVLQGQDWTTWRMDWRPVFLHRNTIGPLKGLEVGTGIHSLEANEGLGLRRMREENLPVCIPVEPEPHDFDAFTRYVCRVLDIALTEPFRGPPWSSRLV